jgi:hypothetical protein
MIQSGMNDPLEVSKHLRGLVVDRLAKAGWIKMAVFVDSKGASSIDWTPLGIKRAKQVYSILTELGYASERSEGHRVGEFEILVELLGHCRSHYGRNWHNEQNLD